MKILCLTPIKHLDGIYEYLESFGTVDYYPNIDGINVRGLIGSFDYDVIFCNPNKQSYKLDENTLKDFTGAWILTASTGLNHIDTDYCTKRGITILSHKNDMKLLKQLPSTAELAFSLMSSIMRNIPSSFDDVKRGNWEYDKFVGHQLRGKTIGIIGYGRLGKMMTKYCEAFDMKVLKYDPYVIKSGYNLDYVLENSDIISLHVHVTDETKYMINKKTLVKLKKNSYIVNTSRGEIVNERDVIDFLDSGHLKGYATDVIENEFDNIRNSPILHGANRGLNIIITPHTGGMTWEGQQKAYKWSINKLKELK
jgi:D-3-phosphoglycerate dehydrogenase